MGAGFSFPAVRLRVSLLPFPRCLSTTFVDSSLEVPGLCGNRPSGFHVIMIVRVVSLAVAPNSVTRFLIWGLCWLPSWSPFSGASAAPGPLAGTE